MAVWPSPWRPPSISHPGCYSSLGLSLDPEQRRLWALGRLGAKCPLLKAATTKVHWKIKGLARLREMITWLVTFITCPAIIYSQNLLDREWLPPLYR